jgi:transposase
MRYTSDLNDAEWQLIDYCFPAPSKKGRPREHSYRELVNAVFYLVKTGCQWRNLPTHCAPWGTVYHYFRLWKRNGLWQQIHTHLRQHVRLTEGRKSQPSAGIIDSQSVKSSEVSDERGYDAGKKINGRKRHVLVDTIGLLLLVMVLPANIQDRDGAKHLLTAFFNQKTHLGRRWLRGRLAGLESETVALHHRNRETIRPSHLQSTAQTLGGGTHIWLVRPLPSTQSRLRAASPHWRIDGLPGHDSPHARAAGKTLSAFLNSLLQSSKTYCREV